MQARNSTILNINLWVKRFLTIGTVFLLFAAVLSPAPEYAQSLPLQIPAADWPLWGGDLGNQRYNGAESAITPSDVQRLTLKWTFAFPDTMVAANEPIVIGDTVYVGSWNGHVYALSAATGQLRWDFFDGITGKNVPVRASLIVANGLVIFGDMAGRVFAVNQADGTLAWLNDKIEAHPYRQITGSLTAYGDRVYVPMASSEEDAASKSDYACCTFRGSLTALNVRDGTIAWRFFTVDPPQARSGSATTPTPADLPTLSAPTNYATSSDSADAADPFGPSGVAIWSTPALDPDAGLIYLTTGNSYSAPESPHSDAILAVNMQDGTLRWSTQLLSGDVWNGGCRAPAPKPPAPTAVPCGPDDDFSSSPLLATINGQKQVFGIQKNGQLSALDALTGRKLWQQSVGTRTAINWGPSFDGQHLYSGDASYKRNGQVYALNPVNGQIDWQVPMPSCVPGPDVPANKCWSGNMTTVSSTPGLVWIGAMDGQAYAFDARSGALRWQYNTARPPEPLHPVNGVAGHGGSLAVTGFTIANGQVYVTSGYNQWTPSFMLGNMLFVLGLPTVERF